MINFVSKMYAIAIVRGDCREEVAILLFQKIVISVDIGIEDNLVAARLRITCIIYDI